MNYKIRSLREKMKLIDIDGMIVTNPVNIRYLTGTNAEGMFLITNKENVLITDARYIEEVNNNITIGDEIIVYDGISVSEDDYLGFFSECSKIGIEENYVTYAKYQNYVRKFRLKETVETNYLVENMRMIKDDDEISRIQKACEITDNCFRYLLDFIKEGMTEKEIALEIEKYFIKNGADGVAFETIVASGENSSKPHTVPTDRKIKNGDAIVIDFGAKYKGYCSDMTRTIFVGEVDEETKNLYNFILGCQTRATSKIKDNAEGKLIAKSLESEFNNRNYSMIHALGHGVGIDVHEIPILSTKSCFTLKENMVVTNEPGIYLPGELGIRIEDTILVNKMTSEVLTKSDKKLIVI